QRLERGRALLRTRLTRRGLGPAALLVAAAWPAAVASATVPASLVASTVKAAYLFAARQALPAGAVSAQAVSLAKGALQTMAAAKLAFVMLVILAVGGVGSGIAVFGRGAAGQASADKHLPEKRNALPPPRADHDLERHAQDQRLRLEASLGDAASAHRARA